MEIIVIGVVVGILSLSLYVTISQKRKGVKCIGCSQAGACSTNDNQKSKVSMDEIK